MKLSEEKKIVKISLRELTELISSAIDEVTDFKKGIVLNEGVKYDEASETFIFDFEHDDEMDIIKLKKECYKIRAFNKCFYYAYEFTDDVDRTLRTSFIHSLKFPDGKISEEDKKEFIVNAVNKLDTDISLPSFDLVVYPESLSELNRQMLSYLDRITVPKSIASIELVKSLPSKIEFNYDKFKRDILESRLENGRPRYTEKQKEEVLTNIEKMMDAIHNLDYFSIARNLNKQKYRQFIENYYSFKDKNDEEMFKSIQNSNVLVIDDIVTSGTTMSFLLKTLRSINDNNNIVIFSLIGKKII